jgi:hypothetical protein
MDTEFFFQTIRKYGSFKKLVAKRRDAYMDVSKLPTQG